MTKRKDIGWKEQGERKGSSAGKRPVGGRADEPIHGHVPAEMIEQGTMIGDYRVERKLDEGGMGTVYCAVHPVIGKRVAIKLLHPHVARQEVSVARFIQEARAVNEIGHPGIVDIFGFGRFVDGRHYIVMEFLEGEHLLAYMNKTGPLNALQASPLVRMIAATIAAAHAKGVIHRDLKPENVFLTLHPDRKWPPRMKLLDFGLAKLVEHKFRHGPQTRMGATVGTPYYMAPEQCRGRKVDARTDIYALGVMFYEMLTGRVPFYAEQPVDVLYMHLTRDPDPPTLWTNVPEPFEKLILECMAKAPELRPPSMNALIAKLESIESGIRQKAAAPSFADLVAGTAELLGASETDARDDDGRDNEGRDTEADLEPPTRESHESSQSSESGEMLTIKPLGTSDQQLVQKGDESGPQKENPQSRADEQALGPGELASVLAQKKHASPGHSPLSQPAGDGGGVTNAPKAPVAHARPALDPEAAAHQGHGEHTAEVKIRPAPPKASSVRWILFAVGIALGGAAGFLAAWLALK
jgi:serine/threonine-protein kinase